MEKLGAFVSMWFYRQEHGGSIRVLKFLKKIQEEAKPTHGFHSASTLPKFDDVIYHDVLTGLVGRKTLSWLYLKQLSTGAWKVACPGHLQCWTMGRSSGEVAGDPWRRWAAQSPALALPYLRLHQFPPLRT